MRSILPTKASIDILHAGHRQIRVGGAGLAADMLLVRAVFVRNANRVDSVTLGEMSQCQLWVLQFYRRLRSAQ